MMGMMKKVWVCDCGSVVEWLICSFDGGCLVFFVCCFFVDDDCGVNSK